MQDGDLVSAPIDLIFNDHVDASCWRRAPRPFKGKLVVANVLVIGLIVAYSARAVPLVAVATALAAGVVAAVAWWLGGRPLAAIEGEVRACDSADGARSLLGNLRERRAVEWFAPESFVPLMEARLQLRLRDYRAAAAAYARASQATTDPGRRSLRAARTRAGDGGRSRRAQEHFEALGDLDSLDPQMQRCGDRAALAARQSGGLVEALRGLEGRSRSIRGPSPR